VEGKVGDVGREERADVAVVKLLVPRRRARNPLGEARRQAREGRGEVAAVVA
jgi:hypothetical protein